MCSVSGAAAAAAAAAGAARSRGAPRAARDHHGGHRVRRDRTPRGRLCLPRHACRVLSLSLLSLLLLLLLLLSLTLSLPLPLSLPLSLSLSLYIYMYISVYLSICLSVCLYLSIFLSSLNYLSLAPHEPYPALARQRSPRCSAARPPLRALPRTAFPPVLPPVRCRLLFSSRPPGRSGPARPDPVRPDPARPGPARSLAARQPPFLPSPHRPPPAPAHQHAHSLKEARSPTFPPTHPT